MDIEERFFNMKIGKTKSVVGIALAGVVIAALSLCMVGCSAPASSSSSASSSAQDSAASTSSSSSSSAATNADDIKVTVSMSEDVTSPEAVDSPLQFAEEQIDVVAPAGSTAIEVLKGTGREIKTEGTGADEQVTAIGGLANGDAGDASKWIYKVNDIEQNDAPGACVLNDGDTLSFVFIH